MLLTAILRGYICVLAIATCTTMDEPNIDVQIETILDLLRDKSSDHERLETTMNQVLAEVRGLKNTEALDIMKTRLADMETKLHQQEADYKQVQDDLKETKDLLATLQARAGSRPGPAVSGGSTYVRWGRTSCPTNGSGMVYTGYAAGGHYTHQGTSPRILCLPSDPLWGKYMDSKEAYGDFVYGVEYNDAGGRLTALFGRDLRDLDVPCAACESERHSQIMIPGRTKCYDGWTLEYSGYLMAGHYTHKAQGDYHCIDGEPEVLDGGAGDQNGYLLYFVETRCEALRCPPYVMGRELPCVVCTK